jgi:hypothetical protein
LQHFDKLAQCRRRQSFNSSLKLITHHPEMIPEKVEMMPLRSLFIIGK